MAILSITFHTEENKIPEWNEYLKKELIPNLESLNRKYLLSEVETEILTEGKNTNLLIFCKNREDRVLFSEKIYPHFSQKILDKFQEGVLVFKTYLNSIDPR